MGEIESDLYILINRGFSTNKEVSVKETVQRIWKTSFHFSVCPINQNKSLHWFGNKYYDLLHKYHCVNWSSITIEEQKALIKAIYRIADSHEWGDDPIYHSLMTRSKRKWYWLYLK